MSRLAGWSPRGIGRDDEGAVLVEFAFCAILFLTIVLGTMDYGRMIFDYTIVSNSARLGVRYASVRGSASAHVATADDVKTYVADRSSGVLATSDITVTFSPNNKPGSTVQVQTQCTFTPIVPLLPSTARTMSSTATMVIVR